NVVLVLVFAALFGMFFLGSLYFQRVRGYDPLGIGLAFLPFSLSIAILSFASGPLITRFGARSVLLPSLALMGVGLLYFSRVPVALVVASAVLRPAEKAEQPALQERERPLGEAAFPAARVR